MLYETLKSRETGRVERSDVKFLFSPEVNRFEESGSKNIEDDDESVDKA